MINCKLLLTVLLSLLLFDTYSQDSLRVSLNDADKLFMQRNLLYAAGQLSIDAQRALEIQSRLYPNPQFDIGLDAYDRDNRKGFYVGRNGEKTFDFQQLILLGGKRKNQIRLSAQSTKQAQLQLENLLRNLKLELHRDLFSLQFDLRTLNSYNTQLTQLDTIINSYEIQANKGNIPFKEVVRLKSVYIKLNNDKTDLLQQIRQEQKNLQTILHSSQFVSPQIDSIPDKKYEQLPTLDSLQSLALQSREDLKISGVNETIADLNVRYQKSLAVPDVSAGMAYDQAGGAFKNQYLLTLGVPLPLWNRNQGNIKFAQTQRALSAVNTQIQQDVVQTEVTEAWANMNRSIQDYHRIAQIYNTEFGTVYAGMRSNFLKRNISIVEFVDFFQSYNETVAEVYRVRKQLLLSAENINFTVAYPVY